MHTPLHLALASDVRTFAKAVWIHQHLDKVAPLSAVELDALSFLADGSKNRRRCLLAFRQFGKTHIIATITCFRLLRDSNRRILIISKSANEVKKTVKLIREWIAHIPFLQHLAPAVDDADAATYFNVATAPTNRQYSVSCLGVKGQLEGNRAHTIIADDIETLANSKTTESRAELLTYANEFTNILYNDTGFEAGEAADPVEILGVGTPKHEETIYLKWANQGWDVRSYPIAYPSADELTINLAPMLAQRLAAGQAKPGEPTCPLRFGVTEIAIRRSLGKTTWLRESQLVANLGDHNRYPFRLSSFVVFDWGIHGTAPTQINWGLRDSDNASTRIENSTELQACGIGEDGWHRPTWYSPDRARFTHTVMQVDPAGMGSDAIGYSVVSHLNGMLFIHDVGGLHGGPTNENMAALANVARRYQARLIRVESNRGGEAFAALLQVAVQAVARHQPTQTHDGNPWAASVETHFAAGNKEARILNALEPVLGSHRLIIHPRAAANETFQYQLTRFTRDQASLPHDDELDALAGAVAHFSHELNIDPSNAAAVHSLEQERVNALAAWVDERAERFKPPEENIPHFARSTQRFWRRQ
jgi:hypothetical protein